MDYPVIHEGGENRILSLQPRSAPIGECCTGVMGIADAPALIPESEWPREGVDLGDECQEILNQDGHSTCWAYGTTTAHQVALALAGMKDVRLSVSTLVGMVRGGSDSGASIQEAVAGILKYGQVPRSMIPNDQYRPSTWPATWKQEAAKYKMEAVWEAQNGQCFETLVTGLLRRQPGLLGTNAFGGGHAVAVLRFYWRDGAWWLSGPNSWGLNYSNCDRKGWWAFPKNRISSLNMFGVGVFQAGVVNPDDLPPPAPAA